jgi:hypothetical protein
MYTVTEASKKLNKSRASIYNKIKKNRAILDSELTKVNNVQMISDKGFYILQKLYKSSMVDSGNDKRVDNSSDKSSDLNGVNALNGINNILEKQLDMLKKQLEVKDSQIEKLQNQSQNYQELLLVKEKQIMQLQEPKEEKNEKNEKNEKEEPDHQEEKSNWFKNLFNL